LWEAGLAGRQASYASLAAVGPALPAQCSSYLLWAHGYKSSAAGLPFFPYPNSLFEDLNGMKRGCTAQDTKRQAKEMSWCLKRCPNHSPTSLHRLTRGSVVRCPGPTCRANLATRWPTAALPPGLDSACTKLIICPRPRARSLLRCTTHLSFATPLAAGHPEVNFLANNLPPPPASPRCILCCSSR